MNLHGYSDTEVILKAFVHYGCEVFKQFNGIFSFAIWNDTKQELFLARDHFGIKPFYYYHTDNDFNTITKTKYLYPNNRKFL